VRPFVSERLDYEGELAVVIGRRGRHIAEADAMSYVAGFTCFNDASVRDWQFHTTQITSGKNFSETGALGPWLVTPDEFGNPYEQRLQTKLNGVIVQSAQVGELMFTIERMIAYLSTICALNPGDVVATGTCAGVGNRRQPQLFMKPGDLVEVSISGIGSLVNPIVQEIQQ
jgi:2-keto-4-pentenoate hydratase/2-oxohepta-3-ene-1,7-dioic acid hydratase in catechol pathway